MDRIIASGALVALILVGLYFIGKIDDRSNRGTDLAYQANSEGTIIVRLGAKCPHDWHCKSISRVEVIDQDGVTLANITEDK